MSNGNYVVASPFFNGDSYWTGAVTWGNGATGTTGPVIAANSLVGSSGNDRIGSGGVVPLTNGNYVVVSPAWNTATRTRGGAVTWGNGTTGIAGPVTAANSLFGSFTRDAVGNGGVVALTNGNYVVTSRSWDNGEVTDAGAVTWGNGATGIVGRINPANSLVGTTVDDSVGNSGGRPSISRFSTTALSTELSP